MWVGLMGLVTLNISRKALLGPENCQQEGAMSRCPFLRVWSPEAANPEGTLMVEHPGMRVGAAKVAGRELTIAAQATDGVDAIHLLPKAAGARPLRGDFSSLLGLEVAGPKVANGISPFGLPDFYRTTVLLVGLWGHLLLLL